MRHRQAEEAVELQRELEKIRMGQSDIRSGQAQMHGENQDRFQRIDLQLEGGHGFDGLVHRDRRHGVRRHVLMNQIQGLVFCLIEMNQGIGKVSPPGSYPEEEVGQSLRDIVRKLHQSNDEDRQAEPRTRP